MDFAQLLNIATNNQVAAQSKASVKRYSTTFSAPKKISKSGVQSEAVQKLLAKKSHEEQQRASVEQGKKEGREALRSQDTKPGKKSKVKSQTNREPLCSRAQSGGSTDNVNKNDGAPPQQSHMSYEDILKLASQKQCEPVKFNGTRNTDNRPMTKKQKALYDEKQARVQRTFKRETAKLSEPTTAKSHSSHVNVSQKKDKIVHGGRASEHKKSAASKSQETSVLLRHPSGILDGKGHFDSKHLPSAVRIYGSGGARKQISMNETTSTPGLPNCKVRNATQSVSSVTKVQSHKVTVPGQQINGVKKVIEDRRTGNNVMKITNGKVVPNSRPQSTKQQVIKRTSAPSVTTSSDHVNKSSESKPFHMNPYMDAPLQLHEPENYQKKQSKRQMGSDDDDDMSDFIDDESCHNEINYSKYIKEMFRVNRSKLVDDYDDDDEIMETSYAEQMKEERQSAKLGYLEDLEDIKKEKEEKKRKMLKKKRV